MHHHLVWARAGRQLLAGGTLLHHTGHSTLLVVKGACWVGDLCWVLVGVEEKDQTPF